MRNANLSQELSDAPLRRKSGALGSCRVIYERPFTNNSGNMVMAPKFYQQWKCHPRVSGTGHAMGENFGLILIN